LVTSVPDQLKVALALAVALAVGAGLALLRERRRSRDARETALRDPLTLLANRVAFDQQLALEWERFQRHGRPFGVLALDLDRLKEVNDEHGHSAGDRILRQAARAIQGRVRRSDFAARLGGDEFCVIVPELGEQSLHSLAAMLREAVEAEGIPISVGWALAGPDEGPIQLLDRADAAMYADKRYRSRSEPSVNVLRPAPPSTVTS
jgi:diguanylate cyclase (GGDEF)-like protein